MASAKSSCSGRQPSGKPFRTVFRLPRRSWSLRPSPPCSEQLDRRRFEGIGRRLDKKLQLASSDLSRRGKISFPPGPVSKDARPVFISFFQIIRLPSFKKQAPARGIPRPACFTDRYLKSDYLAVARFGIFLTALLYFAVRRVLKAGAVMTMKFADVSRAPAVVPRFQ